MGYIEAQCKNIYIVELMSVKPHVANYTSSDYAIILSTVHIGSHKNNANIIGSVWLKLLAKIDICTGFAKRGLYSHPHNFVVKLIH